MAKRKSEKIDLSKERIDELHKIINEQTNILIKNQTRRQLLKNRLEKEKCRLDIFYLDKIFHSIPVFINPESDLFGIRNNYIRARLDTKEGERLFPVKPEICHFEIDEDWCTFEVKCVHESPQILSWEIEKIKYISLIFDRLSIFEKEWKSKRIKIIEKYNNFIKSIDIYECEKLINNAQTELKAINDAKKLEIGLKYVFDSEITHFYGKKKVSKCRGRDESQKIKSLEILKTTPVYCFYKVEIMKYDYNIFEYKISEVKEYKDKKWYVLKLLNENKHKLDLMCAREKKLEKILEE